MLDRQQGQGLKILDPNLEFRVSDLLLPDKELTSAVRFLVAVRHLSGIARSLQLIIEKGSPNDDEARDVLLLHLVGSAKEAADLFRECDSKKLFAKFENGGKEFDEFRAELEFVRSASRKGDSESLYERVLKPYRDKMSFHVKFSEVENALTKLENDIFKAADIDSAQHVVGIPLIRTVMTLVTWADTENPMKGASHVAEVFDFNMAIQGVAHDFFLLLVRISTMNEGVT